MKPTDLTLRYERLRRRLSRLAEASVQWHTPLAPLEYTELPDATYPQNLGALPWQKLDYGTAWGGPNRNFALRGQFRIPDEADMSDRIALSLPLGLASDGFTAHPEALLSIDGTPVAAVDYNHVDIVLPAVFRDNQVHNFTLVGWTGVAFTAERPLVLGQCQLRGTTTTVDQVVDQLRVALETALVLPEGDVVTVRLLRLVEDTLAGLDLIGSDAAAVRTQATNLADALTQAIEQAGPALPVTLHAIGHAHIDTAWQWTLAQTRGKTVRTFATVLHLMDRYPDYIFGQSQPQLYEFIRQDWPDQFDAIRVRIAEGRWEAMGAMWVEADCNLSGGESLVRQFLLGRQYYAEHFGAGTATPVLWLPDAFGYPHTLPQIARLAGVDAFFTTKLRWNDTNDFPYDNFSWRGLDGSTIVAHITPTPMNMWRQLATYNAEATPFSAIESWNRLHGKTHDEHMLMSYGWGDGGGGPTALMLDNIGLMRDFPGLPAVKPGRIGDFFDSLKQNRASLPTWDGELYLETHQGTYTSQARIKRDNRKAEFALHNTEFLASLLRSIDASYTYPAGMLRDAWRTVCLNQFHDILPGSSIAQVYRDSEAQYARIDERLRAEQTHMLSRIAQHTDATWLIVNATPFTQREVVYLSDSGRANSWQDASGRTLLSEPGEDGVWVEVEVAPYQLMPLRTTGEEIDDTSSRSLARQPVQIVASVAGRYVLENGFVRLLFDGNGDIVELFDKQRRRDVLPPGMVANQFQLFHDAPLQFDAWNIDVDYELGMQLAQPASSMRIVEDNRLVCTLEITRTLLHSTCVQRVSLRRTSGRIDFDTRVDWNEKHVLLKVAFPVDVLAREATYHIQWGQVRRATHRNTSWQQAAYEVVGHHWADISEAGYGVSLLNDCKYGYDIAGSVMRLTLLKSATFPDPHADEGQHHFVYSLLPHGDFGSETLQHGYALNNPLQAVRVATGAASRDAVNRAGTTTATRSTAITESWVMADDPHILVETIKQAEDGDGFIVRLYESGGGQRDASLHFALPVRDAERVDLLEAPLDSSADSSAPRPLSLENPILTVAGKKVSLRIKPFEIVSLRLHFVDDTPAGSDTP